MTKEKIKVKLIKSLIGRSKRHLACVNALGLRKINQIVEVSDSPQNRGIINKINYLVQIEL